VTGYFSPNHSVQTGSGAHSPSYLMGTRGSFVEIKRSGREADYSHPSSVEVKNAWSYTSTPQYVFMAWCLVKHRDNFTFTLISVSSSSHFTGTKISGVVAEAWAQSHSVMPLFQL
jgi:hypothetical protein